VMCLPTQGSKSFREIPTALGRRKKNLFEKRGSDGKSETLSTSFSLDSKRAYDFAALRAR